MKLCFDHQIPTLYKLVEEDLDFLLYPPDFIDLPHTVSETFLASVKKRLKKTKIILSYHNYSSTPENIDRIYHQIERKKPDFVKIACFASSITDVFRLIALQKKNVIAIPMGLKGQFGRLMSPFFNAPFLYSSDEGSPEIGLFKTQEVLNTFQVKRLESQAEFFALIGTPIEKSPSPNFHNASFANRGENKLFLKIDVQKEELTEFFSFHSFFKGLAVTIPHKREIRKHLKGIDPIAEKIGAVNTLHGGIGYNTDGYGALEAIEKVLPVQAKKILILGDGGCASAIAYEAKKRGAEVRMLKRRLLDRFKEYAYDILVNATPVGSVEKEIMVPANELQRNKVVFDAVISTEPTQLLKEAKKKGCITISGFEMFLEQAHLQQAIWKAEGPIENERMYQLLPSDTL